MNPDPLLNVKDYTTGELTLFLVGCSLWVVVYGIYIKRIFTLRLIEMPFAAAMSNIAWEFMWGFVFKPDMGNVIWWGYRTWALLDIVIVYAVVRYGDWQVFNPAVRRHFSAICVLSGLFWGAIYYFMKQDGYDTPIGANSAYVAQILISIFYIPLILGTPDIRRFSLPVALARTVGTGLISVFMFLHYPGGSYGMLRTLAATSVVLDCFCVYLVVAKRRGAGWTQTPAPASATA